MRRISKTDANHREVSGALRQIGADVISVHSVGQLIPGFPDLLVGFRGRWVLMEVKFQGGVLTDGEVAFHWDHQDLPIWVVTSGKDACGQLLKKSVNW